MQAKRALVVSGSRAFISVPGWSVWELGLGWSIQTEKSGVLVSILGILFKGDTRGRPRKGLGKTAYHKELCGRHIRNLHLLVTPRDVV